VAAGIEGRFVVSTLVSRRRFVAAAALGSVVTLGNARAATPPKESGLSSEGLLAGRPGFQPRTVMPLPHEALEGFLSHEQLAAHHGEYAGAVERLKATEAALTASVTDVDRYRALRRAQVADANGVLLHELYFGGVAARAVAVPSHVERNMTEHMGSLESWRDDFSRCARAAKAWALLAYDPYDDRWHNAIMDSDDSGTWVGANPLVVCDVAEHAFAKDYRRLDDYVTAFLDHVDWDEVSRRYRAVDRM
jgi:superoxide dismutase, Fe-Mn family